MSRTAALSDEQLTREAQASLNTSEGRAVIGQTILEPFKRGRDYVGIGRQLFYVDHLPQGAPMYYDLDSQYSAVVVAAGGTVPYEEVQRERVSLEPFELGVWVKIGAVDAATARYDMLNRNQIKAQHKLAELEDEKVFGAVQYASLEASKRNTLITGSSGLERGKLADLFAEVEQWDAPVANIVMHSQQLRDIRCWTNKEFDPVTQRELTKTGYQGDIWNAQVRISRMQTKGTVNVLADPQFLGVISVRVDLSVFDRPDGENRMYGWVFFEAIGVAQLVAQGSATANLTGSFNP